MYFSEFKTGWVVGMAEGGGGEWAVIQCRAGPEAWDSGVSSREAREFFGGIFLMVVSLLQYNRVAKGVSILEEGVRQESIIIVVSGHVDVSRKGQHLAKVGPGIVLGESGILTRDTLPVSAIAHEEAEYFELTRLAVRDMPNTVVPRCRSFHSPHVVITPSRISNSVPFSFPRIDFPRR